MKHRFLTIAIALIAACAATAQSRILTYQIFDEINSTSWLHTQSAFARAEADSADWVLLHLNTYGGEVVYADSIRTQILNSHIPVVVFIDNNAASAGALISIACDSIYMRPGANIGAATVVSGTDGSKAPDKYQSYMRSIMRSTAQSHGRDTVYVNGKMQLQWRRDPTIAEAMVDEFIKIEGIVDSGKILTFTTEEALRHGFCEGKAESVEQVAARIAPAGYTLTQFRPSAFDKFKGFISGTALRGILVLIILGGIYFELQTPGVGFPILASTIAAILYFTPLYIDGLAANWEIVLFVIGLLLLGVEIFVLPGFGVAGVAGIICIIIGLSLSLLANHDFDFSGVDASQISYAFSFVGVTTIVAIAACFIAGRYMFTRKRGPLAALALQTQENNEEGYVAVDNSTSQYVDAKGVAFTDLRPSGKVMIDGKVIDAVAEQGFIAKGSAVKILRTEVSQVIVEQADDAEC